MKVVSDRWSKEFPRLPLRGKVPSTKIDSRYAGGSIPTKIFFAAREANGARFEQVTARLPGYAGAFHSAKILGSLREPLFRAEAPVPGPLNPTGEKPVPAPVPRPTNFQI